MAGFPPFSWHGVIRVSRVMVVFLLAESAPIVTWACYASIIVSSTLFLFYGIACLFDRVARHCR